MKHDFSIIVMEDDALLLDMNVEGVSGLLGEIGKLIEKITANDIELAKDAICDECERIKHNEKI